MTEIVEAGPAVVAGATGRTFYRIDGARGTLREYWWTSRPRWTFPLVVLLMKVLRVKSPCSTDDPSVETLAPFEVTGGLEALPAEARALVEPIVREMEGLGFEGPVACRAIDDVLHATDTYLVTMRSGEAIGRAHVRLWRVRQPAKVYAYAEFMTPMEGGGGVWSLGSKPDLEAPAEWRVVRKVGAGATELWAAHRAEVARAGRAAAPVMDDAEARRVEEAHHAAVREFHLRRGIFAPRTEADDRRVEAILRAREAMALPCGGAEADVLAEIERMGQKKRSWWGAVLVLGVSLLLFVAAGKGSDGDTSGIASTWDMMAIIVGVLFVHEFGHYVAMRVFGYRNLRMFFIPFFGAAVSGRHYNVAGWKKVIVSLMGPVPGIVMGVIVGLTGLVLHKAILTKIGLMALILNGFNLLPVLPLDGGWVAHALIFSRNYVLDAAFRLLAAGVLIAGGAYTKQKFLMYMGVASLLALPAAMKVARVVAGLRREGVRTTSPDDQTIPPDVARVIIGRVRGAFPKGASTKSIAQHSVHVFETLNARPPGWLATLGLGTVHVGSFVAALVFAVVLVFGERGFGRFGQFGGLPARMTPKHVVTAASFRAWPEGQVNGSGGGERQTVVATFDKGTTAAGAFDAVRDSLPEGAGERLFGETVMVSLPPGDDAARKGVLRVMKGRTKDVFVAGTGAEAGAVGMFFTCEAPDDATATRIEEEAHAYFMVPSAAHLLPPWASSRNGVAADERARRLRARQTYVRMETAQGFEFGEPAMKELFRKMGEARREGDRAEVRRLEEEQRKVMAERKERAQRAIRDEGEGKVDVGLADRYMELERAAEAKPKAKVDAADEEGDAGAYDQLARELGPRMGQVEMASDGAPAAGAERESARGGGVTQKGRVLTFQWVQLNDVFDGAPAVVRWLEASGCRQIKYTLDGSAEGDLEP